MELRTLKIKNIGELVTYNSHLSRLERVSDTEIYIENGVIVAIGEEFGSADHEIDADGALVTPGFVDPHTHPVFSETREYEFEMRVAGKSYREIAEAGGGILTSVRSLREISEEELVKKVVQRMREFLKLGTTTIEAKSGYGLSTESELKSLKVLNIVRESMQWDIVPTFLGAHAFPVEFETDRNAYINLICEEMIPAISEQGIAQFCDVFCEKGWFEVDDTRRILNTAKNYNLGIRMHVDEFVDSGGAVLAAELGATSADHLMHTSDEGIHKMAESGVTAILLPATTFFLGELNYAPARKFINEGVNVALATDFNPGSSMTQSMPFVMTLACLYLGMTVEEAFIGTTYNSARSLNMQDKVGSLEVGKQADLIIWKLKSLSQIPYWFGGNNIICVIKCGERVVDFSD